MNSDPGVHNWIDLGGRRHSLFVNRWQQLPREPGAPLPAAAGRVVKIADLPGVLPRATPRVDAQARRRQLDERAALFAARYAV